MLKKYILTTIAGAGLAAASIAAMHPAMVLAQQTQAEAVPGDQQLAETLSTEELEILVARIALYPDDLVAVIAAASLFPLQIVEAQRFVDQVATEPDLKPKPDWDGSVVSLLNYPEIVKMMSEDLDWTQALGEAIANQQKDVLAAIQQLRERAVAQGIIKSDDKMKVVEQEDNIVIQPASTEVVYVPQYAPEMLYEASYLPVPISYYAEPYPYYYYPVAPYFAGFITGAIFVAAVDWNGGGVWCGSNWGKDIHINCKNCFNDRDFSGKVNLNDVDWKNVDRSKINFDKNQFSKLDRSEIRNDLKSNDRNSLKSRAGDLKRTKASTSPAGGKQVKDVRASTLDGLKSEPGSKAKSASKAKAKAKPAQGARKSTARTSKAKTAKSRPAGKSKPAASAAKRPKSASPAGNTSRGKQASMPSKRSSKSMGGGMAAPKYANRSGGGGNRQVNRSGGGNRQVNRSSGGGGRRR